jgi:hypothetical protein
MGSPFLAQALAGFLQAAVVVAPVGGEARVSMTAQQRIAEAFNANDRVAEMALESPAVLKVKGRSPGFDPLVLTDGNGKSQVFLVVVPKPKV